MAQLGMASDAERPLRPWEKRLRDLAHILGNCEQSYFDPETFRINTNQFLQTSRTVTFLIQKHKDAIPGFDDWYESSVKSQWAADEVMTWARDARNKIEKEGDLELNSSISVTLIFSYIEEEDVVVPCGRSELALNLKRLLRFARRRLPSDVSDVAVVRLDRRWVTNSLPDWELLHAFTYVYARLHNVCESLATRLRTTRFDSLPHPTTFDPLAGDGRRTRFLRLNDTDFRRFGSKRINRDPTFVPPPSFAAFKEYQDRNPPRTLEENVELRAKFAQINFEHFGSHIPMLFLFDANFKVIDNVSAYFDDQATKYLFWRSLADRILYLKPASLIWICESWIRERPQLAHQLTRNMPITGEMLNVVGVDASDNVVMRNWRIKREAPTAAPRLESAEVDKESTTVHVPNYLIPIKKAFAKLRQPATT